jgi:DNA (cytosine-5)-methyltransferase 1
MFTENELKLKLSLIEAIQAWADTQCETNNWPNVHYGQKTTDPSPDAPCASSLLSGSWPWKWPGCGRRWRNGWGCGETMKLLDLYCCEGGAAKGYADAGFEVVGVDKNPQPNYPYEFHQCDAIEYLNAHWREFDAVHASPPCQFGTGVQNLGKARNGTYPVHVNLIPQTRKALSWTTLPYVIENVAGARKHLTNPVMLCGAYFDLKVYRHRFFECNFKVEQPPHTPHNDSTPSAGNGKSPKGFISVCGSGGVRGMNSTEILSYWSYAMGINWMTRQGLAEAVPPKFTEYIGGWLRVHIERQKVFA